MKYANHRYTRQKHNHQIVEVEKPVFEPKPPVEMVDGKARVTRVKYEPTYRDRLIEEIGTYAFVMVVVTVVEMIWPNAMAWRFAAVCATVIFFVQWWRIATFYDRLDADAQAQSTKESFYE